MTAAKNTSRDIDAEVAFLTLALKAPTLRESVGRLAERARAESWTHEEFLIACLQREVSARDSHGGEGRVRAARFPARTAIIPARFTRSEPLPDTNTVGVCPRLDQVRALGGRSDCPDSSANTIHAFSRAAALLYAARSPSLR